MKGKNTLGLAAAALAAAAIGVAAPANAAQGGNDTSGGHNNQHAWMKVSQDELRRKTVDQACNEIRGLPSGSCSHLVVMVVSEKNSHPNANGYWAEWYYNRAPYTGPGWGDNGRSGTW